MPNTQALLEKIESLPAARIAEVEDFVEFLVSREHDRNAVRSAMAISEPAFARAWDNADDSIYDTL